MSVQTQRRFKHFDKYNFVKAFVAITPTSDEKVKEGKEKEAVAIAEAIEEASNEFIKELATKSDIELLKKDMQMADISLKQDINALEQKIEQRIDALDQKFEQKIDALDQKLEQKFDILDHKIDALDQKFEHKFYSLGESIRKDIKIAMYIAIGSVAGIIIAVSTIKEFFLR